MGLYRGRHQHFSRLCHYFWGYGKVWPPFFYAPNIGGYIKAKLYIFLGKAKNIWGYNEKDTSIFLGYATIIGVKVRKGPTFFLALPLIAWAILNDKPTFSRPKFREAKKNGCAPRLSLALTLYGPFEFLTHSLGQVR